MTTKEKIALAEVLRDHAELIIEAIGDKSGYQTSIDHLDPQEAREQLEKWLDRLPRYSRTGYQPRQ